MKGRAELKMIRVRGCHSFTYMFISQKKLQHEKYRMAAISSDDKGDSAIYVRLSGVLN